MWRTKSLTSRLQADARRSRLTDGAAVAERPYSDGSSQVLWENGERVFSRGWRLDDNGNRLAVLLVAPAADHPSRSGLDRLTHEYELKDELDSSWAARPLALMRDAGRTVLVLDDLGGERLDRLHGGPWR